MTYLPPQNLKMRLLLIVRLFAVGEFDIHVRQYVMLGFCHRWHRFSLCRIWCAHFTLAIASQFVHVELAMHVELCTQRSGFDCKLVVWVRDEFYTFPICPF